MKFRILLLLLAFVVCGSVCNASIIGREVADDGDGVITCVLSSWSYDSVLDEYNMTIDGTHNLWDAGHMLGTFTTNTDLDPTIKVINSIDNDTLIDWTDYHLKIKMGNPFTLSNAIVYGPGGWTANITSQPVQVGSQWVGVIDYVAGTPVLAGSGTLDFGYKMSFSGSTSYSYCQEMVPTPEPGTIVLLACGLIGILVIRRRFA
jgi:hypothetical protein